MNDDVVYLTYYQVMIFLLKIDEMKKNNPHFKDSLANSFGDFVLKRTIQIAFTKPLAKLNLFSNSSNYKISRSLFNYLTNLTSMDVFDKETLNKYTDIVNKLENEAGNLMFDEMTQGKSKIKIKKS